MADTERRPLADGTGRGKRRPTYALVDLEGRVLLERVRMAVGLWQQLVGLIGAPELAEDEGLLIPHCSAIHTFGLRQRIDALYLDREGSLLRIDRSVRPWTACWPARGARSVLELRAGGAERLGLAAGETLRILRQN